MKLKSAAHERQYGRTSTVTDGLMMDGDWKLKSSEPVSKANTSQTPLPLKIFNTMNIFSLDIKNSREKKSENT